MSLASVKEIIGNARSEGRYKLLEHESYEVLRYYGLPVPKFGLARSVDEAVALAEKIGYPVVLKVVSPDIVHKSDVGGVIVNLNTSADVSEAYKRIYKNVGERAPNARVYGVLVQEMVPNGLEVIIGSTRDPTFGPIILFGLGGIFVEVLRDVSLRIAPITVYDAEAMINEIRAAKILEGYRGELPRDKKALTDVILKLSKLVEEVEEIKDVDLNPVMTYEAGRGAKIADARIIIR
ncbi:MAG: acetate--CoA ligase family protein [Sulfolobales archaeon]